MILTTVLTAVTLVLSPPPLDTLVSADSAMSLLRNGGYTILWRHGETDPSTTDAAGWATTERFQQRNLTDRGVMVAKEVGVVFKARGIPVGDVIASPMYRTRETAQYAFGRTITDTLLLTFKPSDEERRLILEVPAPGTNRVLVTHHFIIERNAPGIVPGDVAEGEAAIVKSDGTSLRTIAIIKIADWMRMSGASGAPAADAHAGHNPPVHGAAMPAILHTARAAVVMDYLKAFNSANRDRMRAFFEASVLPNPARTMDQRLDAFDALEKELGMLIIAGADSTPDNDIVVTTYTSTGKTATITFKIESSAPYRAVSINVQYTRDG